MALALDMGSVITAAITSFIRYLSIESYTFKESAFIHLWFQSGALGSSCLGDVLEFNTQFLLLLVKSH
jgi:hypothetical protein